MVEDCDGDEEEDEDSWEAVDEAEGDDVLLPESALSKESQFLRKGRKRKRTIGLVVKV